jgi:hypothetical protein
MSNKPLAGELWQNTHNCHYYFITKQDIGLSSLDQEWIWWHNVSSNIVGNSSLEYFINNCERIS